jgi:site-specific DNA-cytosine methylase
MIHEKTHVDLFSGIGGFALAARVCGIRTIQFCEYDARCREFLAKAWPGVPCHTDVREFHWGVADTGCVGSGQDESGRGQEGRNVDRRTGPVYLLTAGVPCQPASRAGKQRGTADDRWLWPEAVRVISEVRPTWALLENPPGLGDVGLAGVLADVENEGYETRVFSIPACAIGAPHRRERYWIVCRHVADTGHERGRGWPESGTAGQSAVADVRTDMEHAQSAGSQGHLQTGIADNGDEQGKRASELTEAARDLAYSPVRGQRTDVGTPGSAGHTDLGNAGGLGDTEGSRSGTGPCEGGQEFNRTGFSGASPWSRYVWLPCADGKLRRAPDDSLGMAHGLPVELLEGLAAEVGDEELWNEIERFGDVRIPAATPHRSLLGALGNSIVPQVAQRVIAAMVQADEEEEAP